MHASAYAFSLSEKTRIRRQIDREWSQHLRPSESKVLTFLFSATIEWNKVADRFSVDRIAHGFTKLCGTCLSDKTIRRCLDRLEDLGIIRRTRTPAGYRIGINLDWSPTVPLATPREKPVETLHRRLGEEYAAPEERPSTPRLAAPRGGQNDRSRSVRKTDAIEEGHTGQGQTPCLSAKASDDSGFMRKAVRATADLALSATTKAKQAVRLTRKEEPETFRKTWNAAWRETFPDDLLPALTIRDFSQAKLFLRFASARPGMSPMEVVDFCVREWRLIVSSRFAWMTESGAPTLPNIGFMLRFKEQFADAFNDRARLRSEMTMTGAERRTKRLVHQGMSPEEAKAEVAAADRRENERMRAQATATRLSPPRARANPVAPSCDD